MKSHANSRPLTFQVTLTVLALAVFSLAMVVGFGFFATLRADRDALQRQKIFVANGLQDAVNGRCASRKASPSGTMPSLFAKAQTSSG